MEQHLKGKVAIITGSSRGIGRTIAEKLAAAGASVVINYTKTPEKAADVVKKITENGGKAVAICADITKIEEIDKLYQESIAAFGKVDILINNAGVAINKPMEQITEAEFDIQYAVNVKGTYFCTQKAFKYLEDGGSIVNISTSVNGQMYKNFTVYCGTKGAVEQITRQAAQEFGPKKIRINAVAPGPVYTELLRSQRTEQELDNMKNMNAFKRHGETEDIADVIEFLVSEKAHWISGQTLRVNGGLI
ncbi:MAG: glucose 1-dehydrogenase [Clostridia bacterium]|jgi:3-oxoacyl-[acyl-carrier protein] reductase|nr:glucose 1-dehydrogenase [Clostridia bacterium]